MNCLRAETGSRRGRRARRGNAIAEIALAEPRSFTPISAVSRVSGASARRQRGNTMLELVFTMLPTFALVMGFLDLGMMFFRWTTLENAVREGCRYAITFQTASGNVGQDASIKQVVKQFDMGLVPDSAISVHYYAPSNLNTPIASGGNVPGNVVEVSIQNASFNWMLPLSGTYPTGYTPGSQPFYATPGSAFSFSVYSADVLGGLPVGCSVISEGAGANTCPGVGGN